MKGEMDGFGGSFENPSDGWHGFEVEEKIEFIRKEGGDATNTLLITFIVVEEEGEEGRRVFQRFDLDDDRGQTSLAAVLYWSKLYSAVEKNFKITDGADLNEKQWGAKYLCVETSEQATKIVDAIISKLPGKSFMGKVENRTVTSKDPKKPDRVFCNFLKEGLRHFGDKEVLAEMKKKKEGGGTPAKDVKTDNKADGSGEAPADWNT